MLYHLIIATGGTALFVAVWCAAQSLARRYMPGCHPGQDLLDRPCANCGHHGHGCGLGRPDCPR